MTSDTSTSLYRKRFEQFTETVTLYPVSGEEHGTGRSDAEWLDAVLTGGAKIVQLRDKRADDRSLFEKAMLFRQKTREAGALFIVNNRFDIALLSEADGIHLGNHDLPAEQVRKLAPDLLIGVSANTEEQAATAKQRGASYFNIGPLFPTTTKKGLVNFLGTEAIKRFAARCDLPFTVMGGIKFNHIPELTRLNARRIAVVTALTKAPDITDETKRWLAEIQRTLKA